MTNSDRSRHANSRLSKWELPESYQRLGGCRDLLFYSYDCVYVVMFFKSSCSCRLDE
jgi:hypothetical protein